MLRIFLLILFFLGIFSRQKLLISIIQKPSLGSYEIPQKVWDHFCSTVCTFIRYKQTNRQINQPAKYINSKLTVHCKNFGGFFNLTFTQENFPDLVDLNLLFCIVYFDQPCLNQRVRSANNKNLYL